MLSDHDILHCDNHVLAVNKAAGLVTQPSGDHADSLETQAKEWLKRRFNKPGNVFLEAVHRIDRPVSGVVLFGRTSKGLSRLNKAVRDGEVSKRYLALVDGAITPPAGSLRHWLVHGSHRAEVVTEQTPGAKLAILTYQTIQHFGGRSVLDIELMTGRYHQIRAQLSAVGSPILGDRRYGHTKALPAGAIALHHHCLQVPHPVGGKRLTLLAPVPNTSFWRGVRNPERAAPSSASKE